MNWEDVEKQAESGPWGAWKLILVFLLSMMALGAIVGIVGFVGGWFSEAAVVAQEEFGPREALRKYEWFKDAAAQLDKKQADIAIYEDQLAEIKIEIDAGNADRIDKENRNQWRRELAGIKASYNGLAAEYNANSEKFNWEWFYTELPDQVHLPRQYAAK